MILGEDTEKLTTCGTINNEGAVIVGNLQVSSEEEDDDATGRALRKEDEEEKEGQFETSRFFVNTKGTCFLCLQKIPAPTARGFSEGVGKVGEGGNKENCRQGALPAETASLIKPEEVEEGLKYCQWNIFRYLNITPCWIAQCLAKEQLGSGLSPAALLSLEDTLHEERRDVTDWGNQLEAEEDSQFSVLICADCAVVTGKMSTLCEELELIQRRVDECVEAMEEIISKSDNDPVIREEFWERLTSPEEEGKEKHATTDIEVELDKMQEEALHRKVVDMLRRETREKCLNRLKKNFSSKSKPSRLKPLPKEDQSQSGVEEQVVVTVKSEAVESFVVINEEETISMKMELPEDDYTTQPAEEVVMETTTTDVLPYKEEVLDIPASSPCVMAAGGDSQQEWMDSVPEAEQEISIGLCDSSILPNDEPEEFLFEEVPPLPLMEMEADASPGSPVPIILSSSSCLPPPPPPVNLPPKPPKVHKKKRLSSEFINVDGHSVINSLPGVSDCPVDFYFHKKVDNRHVCPFCSDTSPTLTNLRFHVIRAHTEQLFSTSKLSHIPVQDFKSACELMLFTVTKEAETGERNASGTKVIVQCKFCKEDGRVYNDKRAFQCHLILNHYQMLTMRLMGFQNGNGEAISFTTVPINPLEPPGHVIEATCPSPGMATTGCGNSDNKNSRGWVTNSSVAITPNGNNCSPVVPSKKRKRDPAGASEDPIGNGSGVGTASSPKPVFACEHCGKTLSSSTSKWRHKQLYCDVLRNRGEIPAKGSHTPHHKHSQGHSPSVQIMNGIHKLNPEEISDVSSSIGASPSTTSVYLITPQGEILNTGEIPSYPSPITTPTSTGSSIGSNSSVSTDDHVNLDLLLQLQQQANEMLLKVDQDAGGGGGDEPVGDTDEYDQFVGSFQEFYEHEVNDALLDWMETGPEEDPLQI